MAGALEGLFALGYFGTGDTPVLHGGRERWRGFGVFLHKVKPPGEVILEATDLRTQAHPRQAISFSLRKGEVVGVAGLVGSGRTEVLRALFGVEPPVTGQIKVDGQLLEARHPEEAVQAGLALVPEDRKALGVFLPESIRWNIGLPGLWRNRKPLGLRNGEVERTASQTYAAKLRVKAPSDETVVGTLSGGNQQKVALAKWLALRPKVLLLDEPTRGIDVGAKQEIYQLIEELAGEGMGILFVSSEMEEVLAMADRVLVMHEGRISGELQRGQLSEEAVMKLATGTGTDNSYGE